MTVCDSSAEYHTRYCTHRQCSQPTFLPFVRSAPILLQDRMICSLGVAVCPVAIPYVRRAAALLNHPVFLCMLLAAFCYSHFHFFCARVPQQEKQGWGEEEFAP